LTSGNSSGHAGSKNNLSGLTANNNGTASGNAMPSAPASESKLDWKAQKEQQAAARKRENEIARLEAEIEKLETRDSEIDEMMASPEYCNISAKLMELQQEKDEIAAKLEAAYERWEEVSLEG